MTTLEDSLLTDIGFTDALDFRSDANGDIEIVNGISNLKAALMRRLLTMPGTVITLPDYGVGLKNYQNAPMTLAVKRELANLIKEQFERDSRVVKVTSVRMEQDAVNAALITIDVRIEIAGAGEQNLQFDPIGE